MEIVWLIVLVLIVVCRRSFAPSLHSPEIRRQQLNRYRKLSAA